MANKESAAIRRATNEAHKAVERLDSDSLKALKRIYQQAADDIALRIRAHAGGDDNISLNELRSVMAQIEARLAELSSERNTLINVGLDKAAQLGVEPFAADVQGAASMRISEEALRFVRNFIAEDGLQLSDRIWRLDRGARDVLINSIEQAVIEGHGASQSAREFLSRGSPVPIEIQDKLNAANASRLARGAVDQLLTGQGNPLDNALRLFRTEINRAHGEAYMMAGADHPDFAGWRFLLSPAHPKPDICDLLSRQNLYGLGNGVYPSREKCPWPAHPNTLSFLEIVFKDEITDTDRNGKETPTAALARLTDAQRLGVLGKAKTEVFDAGNLRQGMIRAPWKKVQSRLVRQNKLDPRDDLTKQYFNGKVTVDTGGTTFSLAGRELTETDFVRLCGAPDGSEISVALKDGALEMLVKNTAIFQGGSAEFLLVQQAEGGGGLLIDEAIMIQKGQPSGLGLRLFAIQAYGAKEAGIETVMLEAAGSVKSRVFNGYYTWPRYGFDAELTESEMRKLPDTLRTSSRISDLMQSEEGKKWWRENGEGREMEFDLTEGSRSWQTLLAVMKEKGVKP